MHARGTGPGRPARGAAFLFALASTAATLSAQVRPGSAAEPLGDMELPKATLLYQNFPNPFPTDNAATTCIWFDLHIATTVQLTVHDIRGTPVRVLIPGAQVPAALGAGRYGRASEGANAGCDPRFLWDGRDEHGRVVANGVYLIRLVTPWYRGTKKALFVGH